MEKTSDLTHQPDSKELEETENDQCPDLQHPVIMQESVGLNNDIHSWRKNHSVLHKRTPGMFRQLSQGRNIVIIS